MLFGMKLVTQHDQSAKISIIVWVRKHVGLSEQLNRIHVIIERPVNLRDGSACRWVKPLFGKQQGAQINMFWLPRLFMQSRNINPACLGEDRGPFHVYFQIQFEHFFFFQGKLAYSTLSSAVSTV